jgi:replicative DNA helicase
MNIILTSNSTEKSLDVQSQIESIRYISQKTGANEDKLTVITGRHASGKTRLAAQIAQYIATEGNPVLFFSLQHPNYHFMSNLLPTTLDESNMKQAEKLLKSVMGLPLYLDDTESISYSEFVSKIKQSIEKWHIKYVIVDYLQLMSIDGQKFESQQDEKAYLLTKIKELSYELNIHFVVIFLALRIIP